MINDNSLQLLGQITSNENITGFIENGLKGLDYEEGIYIPEEDIIRPTINFSKTHNTPPVYVLLIDIGETYPGIDSNIVFNYKDMYRIFNVGYASGETSHIYSLVYTTSGIYTNNPTTTSSTNYLSFNSDDMRDSTYRYPRYYVTEENFKPYRSSNTYWRAGRTYKWIAVWK